MKFEIDFNTDADDKTLEQLGAKLVPITYAVKYGPFDKWEIELNTFEELEELLSKVDSIKKGIYSAIVSFDPPTIYLEG
jgi:hypothetical protein